MRNIRKTKKGFIAIISLLIITTISMIFAMSMLKDGVDNASLSLSSIYYENARINATTCLEDTLYRIKQEEIFNEDLDYTITDEDSCTTTITWYDPQQTAPGIVERLADLEVIGVSNNFTRTFSYGLKVSRFDVNYSDGSLDYMNNIDIISIEELTS
ncbi:hypothetical protein KJ742_06590 [Patescibacteria group bacterium]|nr:hypothetical protein [Patescibacteria group bacterium]MBU1683580.1 hypothetical protein [Patescibacteria group bacterium]MBU1935484.1 hypothetical protein [Patescibacteria group bacterium]